jgi:GNAT superfamily N-acetyltransferase
MRASLQAGRTAPDDPESRPVEPDDRAALAALMLAAYRGTPDDAGEGPDEAATEVGRLFEGAFGLFDRAKSEVVFRLGLMANATLVTDFRGCPLVAFTMTAPEWKRRGLARAGLLRTMERLRQAGCDEVTLAVTDANVDARRLYESLGFVDDPV